MGLIAKDSGGSDRPLIEAGSHLATCYSVIDVGTQPPLPNSIYDREIHRVLLQWELPEQLWEFEGEEKPLVVSAEYTLSLHAKAKLRATLESWRAKPFTDEELAGFDVRKVAGAPCMLSIIHERKNNGDMFAKVAGVSAMPKGVARPKQFNPVFTYEFEQGRDDIFDSLPEWIQNRIARCREWENPPKNHTEQKETVEDDDVPF